MRPAHDSGVAIGGQRDGEALSSLSDFVGADQLVALLSPDITDPGVNPRCPAESVVDNPAHDRGFSVGRQRDGPTLLGRSDCAGADHL